MMQRQVRGRCPIDGADHAACGPAALVTATDLRGEVVDVQGGPLEVYDVEVGGTWLRLRLSEADARKRGLISEEPPAPAAKAKASRAKNKKVDIEPEASGGE